MELEEEHDIIGLRPGSESGPVVAATVGRAMTTLLNLKPKKLQDAISRLNPSPNLSPITAVSVEQLLWFLHKYTGEAVRKTIVWTVLSFPCFSTIMPEGFELPTRLAVAAADLVLSLTVALTGKDKNRLLLVLKISLLVCYMLLLLIEMRMQ